MPSLSIVPTPIGNLEDITLRALRVLKDVSLILAEDTRHTGKLLRHYGISTRLLSYHQHNKRTRLPEVLEILSTRDVALVTNAGMPAVSDPGFELIVAAVDAGVPVDVLPGANAAITAVVAAAVPAPGFLFAGFLPRRMGERRRRLAEIASIPYSLVLYEAPHRLVETLQDVFVVLGDRPMVVARELTKLHQEVIRGTVTEIVARFLAVEPRGELTLVIAGASAGALDRRDEARDDLRLRRSRHQDARTAVAEAASEYGLSRNEAYRLWLEVSREQ